MPRRPLLLAGALIALSVPRAFGEPPATPEVAFDRDVRPILTRHCQDCHASESPEAGLDLTSQASLLAGTRTGTVVVPGQAAQSRIVRVLAEDADPHMPPDGQLSAEETDVIRKWVAALDPQTPVGGLVLTDKDREHWAFRALRRPAVPAVQDADWPRTPIDRFILARLESAGLAPSPEAERSTLLRRVYFDLIGLPPTPEAIQEFEADDSPDAYERVVDRLLASPAYGERWGRHWLDLARYADSSGFHNDFNRPAAWRYRDYVIHSLNADVPYADFVREQIAGDELPEPTLASWTATGFARNGPTNEDNMGKGLAKEQYRLDELDGIVSTTSTVFLGLTIGCARCHDHMYDPISQRDYYRMLAFFDGTENRRLPLAATDPARPQLLPPTTKHDGKPFLMVRTDRGLTPPTTRLLWRGDVQNPGPEVTAGVPEILADVAPFDPSATAATDSQSDVVGRRLALAEWVVAADNPLTWRVMANRLWQHHFGRGLVDTPGNFGRRGAPPTHPELLDWLADELRRSGTRLKPLHRLIVLSAVYRQSSSAECGVRNAEWAESVPHSVDPDNRLLWRANVRRLEGEPLRDAILAAAGNLNRTMGGPGVKPRIRAELLVASQRNKWPLVKREGPEHWRRSVYVYVKRQLQFPMLELFDAPDTAHSCDRRRRSLVPTQALVLMNDEFVHEQARSLAGRAAHRSADDRARVEWALRVALGREPPEGRIDDGVAFLAAQSDRLVAEGLPPAEARRAALSDLCQVLFNLSEFVYVD